MINIDIEVPSLRSLRFKRTVRETPEKQKIDRSCSTLSAGDLIDVGLIDETWEERLIDEQAQRLRQLLEDPDG
ncbi:MAG: hypothetical protein AAFU85_01370 [Planctomycetota bacterium]